MSIILRARTEYNCEARQHASSRVYAWHNRQQYAYLGSCKQNERSIRMEARQSLTYVAQAQGERLLVTVGGGHVI